MTKFSFKKLSILNKRGGLYICYTLLFAACALLVFSFFIINNKSFAWQPDGLYQHYNAFAYLGSWCRDIVITLFRDHKLVIPMWEFGIGYGEDVFTTLSYYVFCDPFAFISVFFDKELSEYGYILAQILRMYCAGLAFCAYARHMKGKRFATLCGSLLYVFSAYTITGGMEHPFFTNPMIYLPLICLGVELILEKKSPLLFMGMVFVAALSNFYFFYILVLLTVLYVAVRLISLYNGNIKERLFDLLKIGGFAIVGVLMAMVLLFPNIMAFFGNYRVSDAYELSTFYTRIEYERIAESLVSWRPAVPWAYIGMPVLTYVGVGALFLHKKKYTWLKSLLIMFILFLFFPIIGSIFNGFGYASNRWAFAFSFFGAFAFVKGYPLLYRLSAKQQSALFCSALCYAAICMFTTYSRTEVALVACVLLLLCIIITALFTRKAYDFVGILDRFKLSVVKRYRLTQVISLVLTIISIYNLAYYHFSPKERDRLSTYQTMGTGKELLFRNRALTWESIEDKSFYRIDNSANEIKPYNQYNYSIMSHKSTTSAFWSLLNPHVQEFLINNNAYVSLPHLRYGITSRSYLTTLISAKYFIAAENNEEAGTVPYGYKLLDTTTTQFGTYNIYKSNYSLPFGYTYDSVISNKDYIEMSYTQRQQATLQGAVIQDDDMEKVNALPETETVFTDNKLDYTIKENGNVEISDGQIIVKKNSQKITFNFECPKGSELYLYIKGLEFESKKDSYFYTEEDWAALDTYELNKLKESEKYWIPASGVYIRANCGNTLAKTEHYSDSNKYTIGRTDHLLNLNYSNKNRTSLTLSFSEKGIYTFDEIMLISQPMKDYATQVDALREDTLKNVKMGDNIITGSIALEKSKLLCLSLPYSKGWKITVDGEEKELLRVNTGFSGVLLDAGEHEIKLTYCTPYIKIGLCMSAVGLLLFTAIAIWYKRKKQNITK